MNYLYGRYIKEREDVYGNFNKPFFTYDEIDSIVGGYNLSYISTNNGDLSKLYNIVTSLNENDKSSVVLCADSDMFVTRYYGQLYAFFSNISLRLSKMYDYKDNYMFYDNIEVRQYVPSSNEMFLYKIRFARKRKEELCYICFVYDISIKDIESKYSIFDLSNYYLSFSSPDMRSELLLENNIEDEKYDLMSFFTSRTDILDDLNSFIFRQCSLNDEAVRMRVYYDK